MAQLKEPDLSSRRVLGRLRIQGLHQNNACMLWTTGESGPEPVQGGLLFPGGDLSCTARPQLCLEPCCKGDQLDNSQSQKSSILAIPFHAGGSLKLLGEKPQLAFFRETELLIEFRDSRYRAPLRSLFGVPQQLTSTVQLSLSFSLPLSTRQAILERITAATAIAACGKPSTPHPEKSKRQQ